MIESWENELILCAKTDWVEIIIPKKRIAEKRSLFIVNEVSGMDIFAKAI
ncbi:hypothetical protein GQR60_09350 [Labilibaculum sp. A4]|nr:hypothetical protein [Labilibaculum euxinus]MDQ1771567.1 hypothetical protein [Labilibaculum euxinus]MWN76544.1 hypothetical protein [Labilibaculum euxinus]